MARECWYVIEDNCLFEYEENDGSAFLKHGPERTKKFIATTEEARVKYPRELSRAYGGERAIH